MVLPEKADLNLISRTLTNIKNFAGSSSGDQEALPSSPSKTGNAKLISYSVTPKPPPPPLPLPRPVRAILQVCCGNNMKWVTFPVCCAFTFGLFLAFTRASTLLQFSRKGYSSYVNSRQLSHNEPQHMPDTRAAAALFAGGGDGPFQQRMFAAAPPCDCSKCLEREDIYNPGKPQYRTLIKHGLQHFYGHQELALHMAVFVPFKQRLWNLGFALYTTASSRCGPAVAPATATATGGGDGVADGAKGKSGRAGSSSSSSGGNSSQILAVVLVISDPGNVELRQAIRRTWGSKAWPAGGGGARIVNQSRLVFVIGSSNEQRYNDIMLQESKTYDDVVLADVGNDKDSRTKKVISGLTWVDMYCSHAQHVIKVADHVFLDLPRVLDVLTSQDMSNMIYGSITYAKLAHNKLGDGQGIFASIRQQNYPLKWYPPHAGGDFYVLPTQLSKRMLSIATHLPYNPNEDIFITGIMAKVFDARHINIPGHLLDKKEVGVAGGLCDIATRKKMAVKDVTPEMADSLWRRIKHPEMCEV